MLVPIVRKIAYESGVMIERSLPSAGNLTARVGDIVEPFTKLGMTKVSYGAVTFPDKIKFSKGKGAGTFFYTGDVIGKIDRKKVTAPFDGEMTRTDTGYTLNQELRDYWLFAGVWGEVISFEEKRSVLLKTQTTDFYLAVCTNESFAGELVVFPNPSELLEMQYLEKFSKDIYGKVVYVGDYASLDLVLRACELGAGGIVAGGVERESFSYAKKCGLFLGSFSGFGKIPTPGIVFDVLKEISNRFVFVQGDKRRLRVPFPDNMPKAGQVGVLKELAKGDVVQIFEKPFFGFVGKVDSIQEDKIYVILDEISDVVEVKIPNIVVLS